MLCFLFFRFFNFKILGNFAKFHYHYEKKFDGTFNRTRKQTMVNIRLLLLFLVTYCNSNSCNISCNNFLIFVAFLFTCFGFISSFNTLFNIINLLLVKNEKIKRSENLSQSFSQLEGGDHSGVDTGLFRHHKGSPCGHVTAQNDTFNPFSEFQFFIARNNSTYNNE